MDNESNLTVHGNDRTAFNCGVCSRPDHDESNMVFCDNCQCWFHFGCQGVSAEVKDDEAWLCKECDSIAAANYDGNPSKDDVVDQELAEMAKALAMEKELHERKLAKRMELALMRLKLEEEKREMEWKFEKKEMEIRIAAKEAFNRRREAEREQLQQRLEKVSKVKPERIEQRKQVKNTSKGKKRMDAIAENDKKKEKSGSNVFHGKKLFSSTLLEDGRCSNVDVQKNKRSKGSKTRKQVEETPRRNPEVKATKKKNQPVSTESEEEEKEEEGSEADGQSEDSSCDVFCSESNGDSLEESSDEELAKIPDEKGPTKAQMSARQFLARKLPIFTGRPDDWPIFISSYETSTKACGFSHLENLSRLQECLRGPARDAVSSRLLLPEAVPKVVETLRQLYGRPEQLLSTLMTKVRKADPPKADRLTSFISFGMIVQQLCDHLEATNLLDHLVNPMLIQELVEKLPAGTKLDWVRFKRQQRRVTLRTLADFLSELVSAASEVTSYGEGTSYSNVRSSNVRSNRNENGGFIHTHSGSDGMVGYDQATQRPYERTPCQMCGNVDHRIRNCDHFRRLDQAERLKAVEYWRLCRICLNAHGTARCKLNIRCKVDNCNEPHNSLLHQVLRSECNTHTTEFRQPILFRMVPVVLYNGKKSVKIMAFLDEGSSFTLIESNVTKLLGCKGITQPLRVTWTAGMTRVERDSKRLNVMISALGSSDRISIQNAHTVEELKLPEQSLHYSNVSQRYKHLRDLPVVGYTNETPKILIGLKHRHLYAPLESRVGKAGEPIAVRSKLGWTVYGPQSITDSPSNLIGHHKCSVVSNQELYNLLKSHYVLEEAAFSVELVAESDEDRRSRQIMEKTTRRVGKRFETGLLWKEENMQFPDNYNMAVRRMKCLERRLSNNPELLSNVRQQIVDYQVKGYCHRATQEELTKTDQKKVWYLPINIVINPKKPHKVRLVWDAAAAVGGISLNSKLLKGPDFLTSLPSVIFKFREHLIGFGGDIREMFHQLKIRSEDKQAQRFLLFGEVYVMDCAIFGATCSPSQALFIKDKNAREFASEYPDAVAAIIKKHYVDDYFDSADTVEEAVKRAEEVRNIHSEAGFQIRNWVSNSVEVLQRLGEPKVNQEIHFNKDKTFESERVLGIVWNTQED